MREVLVAETLDGVRVRQQHERAQLVPRVREQALVEVGERDDQPDVVLVDDPAQRGDVVRLVDPRHERVPVGVVQRGRERVRVRCDRGRAGPAKSADDVNPLAGAREENRCHDGEPSFSTAGRGD